MKKQFKIFRLVTVLVLAIATLLMLGSCVDLPGDEKKPGEAISLADLGIKSVEKIKSEGLIDTYLLVTKDGEERTFTVANGADGKDGISIIDADVNQNGELILTFSEGTPLNLGKIVGEKGDAGKDGVGIKNVTLTENGKLTVLLTNNTSLDLGYIGNIRGDDGVSVTKTEMNLAGELLIHLSNGTVNNVGKVAATDGVGIKNVTLSEEGVMSVELTDGRILNLGNVKYNGTDNLNCCSHIWTLGVCEKCSIKCNHSIVDRIHGYCAICGTPTKAGSDDCTHAWVNGQCSECFDICEHSAVDVQNSLCLVCGGETPMAQKSIHLVRIYDDGEKGEHLATYKYPVANLSVEIRDILESYFNKSLEAILDTNRVDFLPTFCGVDLNDRRINGDFTIEYEGVIAVEEVEPFTVSVNKDGVLLGSDTYQTTNLMLSEVLAKYFTEGFGELRNKYIITVNGSTIHGDCTIDSDDMISLTEREPITVSVYKGGELLGTYAYQRESGYVMLSEVLAKCFTESFTELLETYRIKINGNETKNNTGILSDATVSLSDKTGYAWTKEDNKTINMRVNLFETGFTNLSRRYITGENLTTASAKVDELVAERNQAAQDETMVKVNYLYWEGNEGGWGDTDEKIIIDKNSYDPDTTPDIYITAVYDCIWATFSDGLANLVGTVRDDGNNYFSFLNEDYDSSVDDLGYNYDLMRSFSPIPDRAMFMLASDYTIDVFRAIHAMPVSIWLLEGIDAEFAIYEYPILADIDADKNGIFEMQEFADFIMDGKWTWDVLAALCEVVYEPNPGLGEGESFGANKFGFYMDVWAGSSANAIVFGSPFAHFTKTYDANGVPTYTQKDGTEFMTLANAITKLWQVQGAARVINGTDAQGESSYGGALGVTGHTSLDSTVWTSLADAAIMEKFGRNEVLFMNNTQIGCIEFSWLEEMEDGFGIAPMPVIEATPGNPQYTTCIGNAARCAAVNAATQHFMEVTAYLDYQSTHSGDIIRAYFRSQQYDATNGESYNIDMLEYLRSILLDQEAHIMNIYCQRYLTTQNAANFTDEHKAQYFTGSAEQYDFSGSGLDIGSYRGIVRAFTVNEDPAAVLENYYTQEYINTINVMYKVIVDKFLSVADTL